MSAIAVVGGGIIGVAIGIELQDAGNDVTILEPSELGTGVAAGSAGYLSEGEIFPLARPGIIRALPSMLSDPLGPLVIRPAHVLRMSGWGLRFLRASTPTRFAAGTRALASLNQNANDALLALAQLCDAESFLECIGGLHVCRDDDTLAAVGATIPTLREHGIVAEVLSRDALAQREPHLDRDLAGALYLPNDGRCKDPRGFGLRLGSSFVARGGNHVAHAATTITARATTGWEVATDGGPVIAEKVIVAAGVWSGAIMRRLGHRVPIEAERGYHLMLPAPNVSLRHPVVFEEPHFAATSMNAGLRLAGTVEFGGTRAPMNPLRSDVLFDIATRYLPGISAAGATRWMGLRPSLPDSLPAIGASSRVPNLYYSFGHQHLGLTQAAVSARVVRQLVGQHRSAIDVRPFDLERFA
jgi:D-amino-acid dehydrogenase